MPLSPRDITQARQTMPSGQRHLYLRAVSLPVIRLPQSSWLRGRTARPNKVMAP